MSFAFSNRIKERSSQSAGLVVDMALYTETNSVNGSANTGDVAEALTTALDFQTPPVNDLRSRVCKWFLL
jgi:hypothetical protein